jgi:hypothetical protein
MTSKQTKIVDCVQFKYDLHKALFQKSGASNLREYIHYINAAHIKVVPVTAKSKTTNKEA